MNKQTYELIRAYSENSEKVIKELSDQEVEIGKQIGNLSEILEILEELNQNINELGRLGVVVAIKSINGVSNA